MSAPINGFKGNRATFEGKEDKESKLVLLLFRIVYLGKEAKMVVRLEGVIVVCHEVCEGVGYVP